MGVLSKTSVNALRALILLTSREKSEGYTGIREMAEELDISFHFLTKILQVMTQGGILRSYRGPRGGVSLACPPEEIHLIDVVRLFEDPDFFDSCLLGLPGCGKEKPCPVHEFWSKARTFLEQEFRHTDLATLGSMVRDGRVRLTG